MVCSNCGILAVIRFQIALIRGVVDAFLHQQRAIDRVPHLLQGRGLWAQRRDLPDWAALRSELDR